MAILTKTTAQWGLLGLSGASILISIIVLGIISTEMEEEVGERIVCYYSNESTRRGCDTGIAISIIALLVSLGLTGIHAVDVLNYRTFKDFTGWHATIVRTGITSFQCFLWLIAFIVLEHDWINSTYNTDNSVRRSPAVATIVFSFMSFLLWGGLTGLTAFMMRVASQERSENVNAERTPRPVAAGAGLTPVSQSQETSAPSQEPFDPDAEDPPANADAPAIMDVTSE